MPSGPTDLAVRANARPTARSTVIVTGSVTSRGSVETVADVDRNTCPEFGHVNTGVRDPVEAARDQQGARVVSATDR